MNNMVKLKYNVGDTLSIITGEDNTSGHGFKKGELVKVTEVNDTPNVAVESHYRASNNTGDWFIKDEDCVLYNNGWFCEDHPESEMGHDGCNGAGIPESARIEMLVHRRKLALQELKETVSYFENILYLKDNKIEELENLLNNKMSIQELFNSRTN